jgi:hypothetical protein
MLHIKLGMLQEEAAHIHSLAFENGFPFENMGRLDYAKRWYLFISAMFDDGPEFRAVQAQI